LWSWAAGKDAPAALRLDVLVEAAFDVRGARLRVIADVTRPDIIQRILEHVARQQAPPDFSASSGSLTVH
jgi:hypothetical protein